MYLHAERHVANAGGSNCKQRGIAHPCNEAQREWKGRSVAEGCTSEARKPGETACGREGAAPIRRLVYRIRARQRTELQGRRCGQDTGPHGWDAENARYYGRLQRGKGTAPFPTKHGHGLTSVRLQATVNQVRIRNFIHKGLKKLYADDATKGVPPDTVDKLRKMFAFLDDMEDPEELRTLPSWKAHILTGDRKGTWSLSVTANRRLTFRIDTAEREIYDVNLEDYH